MKAKTKVRTSAYRKRDYQAFLYLLPWLLGFSLLQLYPFVSSLYYSFTDYQITSEPVWAGLKNYISLFTTDTEFTNSLKVTITYTLYTVPGKLIMALAVAVFLNRNIKGINLIRTLYYIPSLFGGSVATAILWKLLSMHYCQRCICQIYSSGEIPKLLCLPSVLWKSGSLVLPWSCSLPH